MNWYKTTKFAFPAGIPNVWSKKKLKDIGRYLKKGFSFKNTAEHFNTSISSIYRLNREYKWVQVRAVPDLLTDTQQIRIKNLHIIDRLNSKEIAERTGINKDTIKGFLIREGINENMRSERAFAPNEEQTKQIIKWHLPPPEGEGRSISWISKQFGPKNYREVIYNILKRYEQTVNETQYPEDQVQETQPEDLIQEPENSNKESKMSWYKILKFAFPGRVPIKLRRGDIGVLRKLVKERKTFDELLEYMNSSPDYSMSPGILKKLMKEKNIPIPRKVREKEKLIPEDIEILRESVNEGETFDELLEWMNSSPDYSISPGLLKKLMQENNIPVPRKIKEKKKKQELSPSNIQALKQLVDRGKTFEELLEFINPDPDTGISALKLRGLMNENGIPIPRKARRKIELRPEDVEVIRQLVNEGNPFDTILETFNPEDPGPDTPTLSAPTLTRIMNENNIPIPKTFGRKKLEPSQIEALKKLTNEGKTFNELLEYMNSSPDFSISPAPFKRMLEENNIPIVLIRPRIEIPDEIQTLIINLNRYKNKSPQEISKYVFRNRGFEIAPNNIYNFLTRKEKFKKKERIHNIFEPTPEQLTTIKRLYFAPPLPTTQSVDEKGREIEINIKDIKDIMALVPGIEKTGYGISYIAAELQIPMASLFEWFRTEGPKHGIINRTKKEQLNTSGHRARKSIEKIQMQKEIGGYIGKLLNAKSKKSALGMLGGWRAALNERAEAEDRPNYTAMAMYNKHIPFIEQTYFSEDFAKASSRAIANEMLDTVKEVLTRVPWFFDYFKDEHAKKLMNRYRDIIENTVYPGDEQITRPKIPAELLIPHMPPTLEYQDKMHKEWEETQLQKEINEEEMKNRLEEVEFYKKIEEEEEQKRLGKEEQNTMSWYKTAQFGIEQ